jgi:hypothetical protein
LKDRYEPTLAWVEPPPNRAVRVEVFREQDVIERGRVVLTEARIEMKRKMRDAENKEDGLGILQDIRNSMYEHRR